jgi:hypothetical protein
MRLARLSPFIFLSALQEEALKFADSKGGSMRS